MPLSQLAGVLLVLAASAVQAEKPVSLQATVTQTLARDEPAFTQGLEIHRERLLQSSGLYGQSYIESIALPGESAEERTWRAQLPRHIFAEGLTVLDERLYLLSWRRGQWWRLDPASGERLATGHYSGEGWGLTHFDGRLVRSDGSSTLTFHAPEDFAELGTIEVTETGKPLEQINELEYACERIWANLWHSERIVAIDPTTGEVSASADLSALAAREAPQSKESVLNGIAWESGQGEFWVTGKRWKNWYRVRLTAPDGKFYCPGGPKKAAPDDTSDAAR